MEGVTNFIGVLVTFLDNDGVTRGCLAILPYLPACLLVCYLIPFPQSVTNCAIAVPQQVASIHKILWGEVLGRVFFQQVDSHFRVCFSLDFNHSFLQHNGQPSIDYPNFSLLASAVCKVAPVTQQASTK